jgi:hypothetical protein
MFTEKNQRVRDAFGGQFTEEEGRIVYRRALKDPPIAVSAAERDGFIETYVRWFRRATMVMMAALWIVTIGMVALSLVADRPLEFVWMLAGVLLVAGPFVAANVYAWSAPARALKGRPPVGPALPRAEVSRRVLKRITWPQLGAVAVMGLLTLRFVDWSRSLWGLENVAWVALALALLLVCAVQAVRKLRAERG